MCIKNIFDSRIVRFWCRSMAHTTQPHTCTDTSVCVRAHARMRVCVYYYCKLLFERAHVHVCRESARRMRLCANVVQTLYGMLLIWQHTIKSWVFVCVGARVYMLHFTELYTHTHPCQTLTLTDCILRLIKVVLHRQSYLRRIGMYESVCVSLHVVLCEFMCGV